MKKQKRESDNLKKLTPERQKIRAWKIWPKLARYAFCRLSRLIGRCMWAAYLHRSERARSVGHISHGSGGAGASTGAPLAAACGSVADRRLAEINALRRNPLGAGGRRRVRRSAGRLLAAAVACVGAAQSVAPLGCAGLRAPSGGPSAALRRRPPTRPTHRGGGRGTSCAPIAAWLRRSQMLKGPRLTRAFVISFYQPAPACRAFKYDPGVRTAGTASNSFTCVWAPFWTFWTHSHVFVWSKREWEAYWAADCERAFHLHMCVRVCCGAHQMTPVIYAHFKS